MILKGGDMPFFPPLFIYVGWNDSKMAGVRATVLNQEMKIMLRSKIEGIRSLLIVEPPI